MRPLLIWTSLLVAAAVIADTGASPPDVTRGEIDGKIALYVLPLSGVEDVPGPGATFDQILPGQDCEVHLSDQQNPDRELVYDCSKWVLPPAGNYRLWLEAPDAISEGYAMFAWQHEPFEGRGTAIGFGLEPAGRVALAESVPLSAGTSFRLVHLRSTLKGTLRRVFDRRVAANSVRTGVPMPVGPVLAGIFDSKSGDVLALSRPVTVPAGKTVFAAPVAPKTGSDVFVVLTRPRITTLGKDDVSPALTIDAKPRAPDVLLSASDRLFAVWYGIHARKATLNITSKTLHLPPVDLTLTPNTVTTHRAKLTLLPSLTLNIHAPEAFAAKEMKAELRRANTTLEERAVKPNGEYRFESLPAEPLEIILTFGPWKFRKPVDLTAGADETVTFTLAPLVLTGTVFHGREPAPKASIEFHADNGVEKVIADESGRYEAVLWRRDDYVAEVKVANESMAFVEGPFEIQRSEQLDFRVPRTRFEVDVKDAMTGKGIANAQVFAGSRSEHRGRERNVLQTAMTDARGRAILPPLREGALILRVHADGYRDPEATNGVVERIDDEGHYEIALQPVGETISVRLKAGAEVWAVASATGYQQPLWRGAADASGTIAVPRSVKDTFFLIRAEGSAPAVKRLNDEWTLSDATAPLTLKLDRQSRLALWIDGVRVSGAALIFLTRSLDATGTDGLWTAAAVPAQPLRVLAWRKAAVESGAFDAVAETLSYPWPAVVLIHAVD